MNLSKAAKGKCNRLFFTQYDQSDTDYYKHLPEGLPKEGWTVRRFKPLLMLHHKELPDIICNIGNEIEGNQRYVRMMCSFRPIYEHLLMVGGTPVHAGLIVKDGSGVLLIAPQKVGKSTCCKRIPLPWVPWSDDLALIVRDTDSSYNVHPMPTLGNILQDLGPATWDVEAHVPLKAIFILEQSKFDQAVPARTSEAALEIYNAALRGWSYSLRDENMKPRTEIMKAAFNNACEVSKNIPCYNLCVSIDGHFWEEINRVLSPVERLK